MKITVCQYRVMRFAPPVRMLATKWHARVLHISRSSSSLKGAAEAKAGTKPEGSNRCCSAKLWIKGVKAEARAVRKTRSHSFGGVFETLGSLVLP
eukprot:CAMPEP_0174369074 /NCGR_PEP_ID=MMETSP0811_2-20130205/91242_1 /TAXON_ID=73025 ORGANISM="Eutreptiella gymnastica-like, Strain CCMP1594" /NCGR_SAMPLE_ID=MMETSP0811_2 /ASSEMBLY_ACC=CAM_ASM_000667 /LENGTH=94 /DNA_ID=CAMNT_0015513157 /DNA_START=224 /DNA_END=508 /DNA_ORIENTATION=-